ncbi:MAG: nucleotide exchange factor GrpE [Actinomycetota bacterium]
MSKRPGSPDQSPRRPVTIHDRRRVREPEVAAEAAGSVEQVAGLSTPAGPREAEAAAPASPLAELEAEVATAREEAAGHLDDLRRLKAEFDNYRKRILREQTDLAERAAGGLATRLLRIVDDFELAVRAAEEHKDFQQMLRGVEMVYGELKELLASEGVTPIEARGKPFDPNYHEAAYEVPGSEGGEPYVAEVLRTGYVHKGRVLRPAMVKVARRAPEQAPGT